MRALHALWFSLLALCWLGCSTAPRPSLQHRGEAEVECDDPGKDRCVTLLCLGDACGFYRCEDMPGALELARFPPSRPPAAAAAPGSGPRRNWGGGQHLPRGAVMVFPNWNGAPAEVLPPSRQLTAGRWEKHHIFPQAQEFREWFIERGVKIHDYTMPLPYNLHREIHRVGGRGGQWNQDWRDFKRANPFATPEEIYQYAGELIYRFQLIGGPIQPYHSRPGI
ncbi:SitA6 family polymorphic toxin lipoprotein [Pyxidicoccus xibeiensis]|uniref:SitA6 family polymorphic toxin lipoprotein n=1 Tax=Pyxidicoccus xibeiensis TaxID=2906759 RepID=UPI0020A6E0AD|nr:TIGR02269 family lipoprotein [Pyxidicoccus xibeiensis]MCP3136806.1 TIGR02269 family lipoprotein [Pyxidicoccus xibeiensis]